MYDNMWIFINPDVLMHMFPNLQFSYMNNIWEENIPPEYSGTICFKGDIEDGHYIYVSKFKDTSKPNFKGKFKIEL